MRLFLILALLGLAAVVWWRFATPKTLSDEAFAALYAQPLPPQRPAAVYHLGHSLVGRDMPAMLSQLMGNRYHSQLGWGASLRNHWQEDVPGFSEENRPPAFRPVREALASGAYDALVVTEMVELKDAIRYHDSARALADWARLARAGRPDLRIYLYETWHRLDDPGGWETRLKQDLPELWEGQVLRPALAIEGVAPLHVIPAGQVMGAVVARIEAGDLPGLTSRRDLFGVGADGTPDPIHLSDLGLYLVALTHFAVLSGESPVGLPHALQRADGSPATAPTPEAARIMQEVVWQVVTGYAPTGVKG
ncbi:MAG: hypothetical protein JNN06_10995 [Gemmobacter sp.]|uniref:hypothetical protein n=1 Tax=Gemmobacter sp. TaxID=1898957 RepID=UPI001A59E44C|nr:hypothetical protein [Gemmobacter sp.]MBL8562796.1 hypothetical protein [Gemmobacter sp.]